MSRQREDNPFLTPGPISGSSYRVHSTDTEIIMEILTALDQKLEKIAETVEWLKTLATTAMGEIQPKADEA